MPEYPTDEDGRPTTGLAEPTPAAALDRIARNTDDLIPRIERAMADLRREIARWPRPIPPDQWEQLVDEVTERLREKPDEPA